MRKEQAIAHLKTKLRDMARRSLARTQGEAIASDDDPPVVARVVVELRADDHRTVVRGAVEDAIRDERVALEGKARTPMQLAALLSRSLFSLPFLARDRATVSELETSRADHGEPRDRDYVEFRDG